MALLAPSAFVLDNIPEDYLFRDSQEGVLVVRSNRATTQTDSPVRRTTATQGQPDQSEVWTQVSPRRSAIPPHVIKDATTGTEVKELVARATSPVARSDEMRSQDSQTVREVSDVSHQTECPDNGMEWVLKELAHDPESVDCDMLGGAMSHLVPHISQLKTRLLGNQQRMKMMEEAIKQTIPDNLELQNNFTELQYQNTDLENTIRDLNECIELLEKRLESQLRVMALQEEGLSKGDGAVSKVLSGWRKKVLQMLVEKELNVMRDDRKTAELEEMNERLQVELSGAEREAELLRAKQQDMAANLRLKDKLINNLTSEISILRKERNHVVKTTKLTEEIPGLIATKITEAERRIIAPTLATVSAIMEGYETQITEISSQLEHLKVLYQHKESFFSDKLEALLTKHTTPKVLCPAGVQTTLLWDQVTAEKQALQARILEAEHRLSNALAEKGILSSQVAEVSRIKAALESEFQGLQDKFSEMMAVHQAELAERQKRESRTAIHAKHLERKLASKELQIREDAEQCQSSASVQVDKLQDEVKSLRDQNASLRKALKLDSW